MSSQLLSVESGVGRSPMISAAMETGLLHLKVDGFPDDHFWVESFVCDPRRMSARGAPGSASVPRVAVAARA
jgi:hypothetical protein